MQNYSIYKSSILWIHIYICVCVYINIYESLLSTYFAQCKLMPIIVLNIAAYLFNLISEQYLIEKFMGGKEW